jgi:predicted DNA-binding protein
MAGNDRHQLPFRLSADHMNRLDRAAKHCGQTRQAFVQATILAEIAEVEERMRMKKLRTRPSSYESMQREEVISSAPSSGMGIGDALRQRREVREEPITPTAQSPVVVNVGSNATGGAQNSDIDRLAAFVVNGNDIDRDTRLRTAVAVLSATTSTDEERKVLAARLDEVIAAKTKTSTTADDGAGVKRIARVAFDKLADFWKGE